MRPACMQSYSLHCSMLRTVRATDQEGLVFVIARQHSMSSCVTCSQFELSNTAPCSQEGMPLCKTGGCRGFIRDVHVQSTDKAAVDCRLPAFAHAGSCTVVQGIALQLKGIRKNLRRECSPV